MNWPARIYHSKVAVHIFDIADYVYTEMILKTLHNAATQLINNTF